MKSSILVNCLWGSARSHRMDPVHFRPPIYGPVLSLRVHAPILVPRRPPAKGPVCNKENYHPGKPLCGSARSSCEAHIHSPLQFTARFRVLSRYMCRTQGCCCRRGRGRPSWWTIQAQHAVVLLLPDPCHAPVAAISPPTSRLTCQVPHVVMLCTEAVRMKSLQAAERTACLPVTHPLQLLTVFCCFWFLKVRNFFKRCLVKIKTKGIKKLLMAKSVRIRALWEEEISGSAIADHLGC